MDVFETLVLQIDNKTSQIKEHICAGKSDIDEYKKLCGEIRGLLLAREYILDLKQTTESSE
jgi:hypothetical protein